MSLINDALKKAQAELKQQQSTSSRFTKKRSNSKRTKGMSGPAKVMMTTASLLVGSAMVLLLGLLISPEKVMNFVYPEHKNAAKEKRTSIARIVEKPIYTEQDFEKDEVMVGEDTASDTKGTMSAAVFANLDDIANQLQNNSSDTEKNSANKDLSSNEGTVHTVYSRKSVAEETMNPMQKALKKLSVTGVMFSGQESKVIINSRVCSLNAVVNKDPELRLKEILAHEIVLADNDGNEYRKEL